MNNETAKEIEVCLAHKYFNPRVCLMVPNISWGLNFHDREIDLLVLTKANYAWEIEIKVSRGDLSKDQEKRHHHHSNKIKRLYFAIPEKLVKHIELIPSSAGILVVGKSGLVNCTRNAEENRSARKLTNDERYQLARLGTMRFWNIKQDLLRAQMENRQ